MKKFPVILLLLPLIGLSPLAFEKSNFKETFATDTVYVDLGPGVYNPNKTETSVDDFVSEKYSIAYRAGAIMLFPNNNLYEGIAFNTPVPSNELVDTNFSKIRIYKSANSYKTINEYFIGGNAIAYNIFNDDAQNVSFHLDNTKLAASEIYKITFDEGFVLPYPSTDHSIKYALKETVTFVSSVYGQTDKSDITFAHEWTRISTTDEKEEEEETGIVLEDVAAFSRTFGKGTSGPKENYRLQIRGSNIDQSYFDDPSKFDIDDNSCRLYIYFGDRDYNPEIINNPNLSSEEQHNIEIPLGKMDLSTSETSYLNTLYNHVLFTTQDDEVLTLKDVSDPFTKGLPVYNASGEDGCLVFMIGNNNNGSLPNYNGRSFKQVTVLRGAQFPSYRFTNGDSSIEYRYQQVDDITVNLLYCQAVWTLTAQYAFNAANINITSVGTRKVNIDTPDLKLNAVVVDIGLSECNYEGVVNQRILTVGENMTRYVYINGRSIYYAYKASEISAYANLDGKSNTISIVVPFEETSQITEIIVQRGCSIPSLVASSFTMEIYGGYVSYYVLSTASYALNDGTYQETAKIYWTLWFDGKNPIRVENTKTFDFSVSAPTGDNTDRQRFVKWINENGDDATGYKRITDMSSKEFFGVYIYSQYIEFKNIDKEFSVKVDRFTRLTNVDKVKDIIIPKRKGYTFQGWVDEEGNHYNIDNRVTRDLVLTATWISSSDSYIVKNNTPLLIATISVASLATLVIVGNLVIFLLKKKSKTL